MKFAALLLMSLLLTVSCAKREVDTDPSTETVKQGGDAGTGSVGSLGSTNPGNETGGATTPPDSNNQNTMETHH